MVSIICVSNHERISWVSIEIYYHDNFVFGHIFMFLTSILLTFAFGVLTWSANSKKPMESRTMVCCLFMAYALELNTTICWIVYSIWLGARRIIKIGLKIMG